MTLNIRTFIVVLIQFLAFAKAKGQVLKQDSLALVALYDATDGDHWTNHANWKQGKVATWHGVRIFNKRVTQIDLSVNNLTGELPNALGDLTSLRELALLSNHISGPIPAGLKNCTLMSGLFLDNNKLSGEIPPWIFERSGVMHSLFVSLDQNEFTGELPVSVSTNAITTNYIVSLRDNHFVGKIHASLLQDPTVTGLILSGNNLSEIEPWTNLGTKLVNLHIENNQFTFEDIEPFIGRNVLDFTYSPQESIYTADELSVSSHAKLTLKSGTGGSANQYQWFKDGVAIAPATGFNYSWQVSMQDAGLYTAQVASSIVPDLILERNPITLHVKEYQHYVCQSQMVTLDASVLDVNATYAWSNGATTPTITVNAGDYGVRIETSNYILEDTFSVRPLFPLALGGDVNTCEPTVKLISNIKGANSYEWQTPSGTITGVDELVVTTSGTYRLKITANACALEQTDIIEVVINPFIEGSFTVETLGILLEGDAVILPGTSIEFRNTTPGAELGNFAWSMGDGTTSLQIQPSHVYKNTGTYTVSLMGTDSRGCPVSTDKTIEVQDMVITTAISPNGDGKNDKIFIEPLNYESSFKVIDRNGRTVFDAATYKDDFTGRNLESGVYYYELYLKAINKRYKGTVHIVN